MLSSTFCLLVLSLAKGILGAPVRTDTPSCFVDPECGPIPGDSPLYSDDISRSRPFPADMTAAVLPTPVGPQETTSSLPEPLKRSGPFSASTNKAWKHSMSHLSRTLASSIPPIRESPRSATIKQATCTYFKILFHQLPLSQDLAVMILCGKMLLGFWHCKISSKSPAWLLRRP